MIKWRQMIKFEGVEAVEPEKHTRTYGKFCIKPLENGYGLTLGNALRRILLSSIQGVSIVAVRIEGVLHEFSILPGVVEDVAEILLSIKQIELKADSNLQGNIQDIRLSINAKGKCKISAGDIVCPPGISVLNPNLHIAELSSDGSIEMELMIDINRGYIPANEYATMIDLPKRFIILDCDFSPIKRVGFKSSNYRINNKIDYDQLEIEIYTNGSVTPRNALSYASIILREHFDGLIGKIDDDAIFEEKAEEKLNVRKERLQFLLKRSINELDLTVRPINCLQAAHIKTLGDLVRRTEAEMLKYRNFGRKSLEELKRVLSEFNLKLGMDLEGIEIDLGIAVEENENEAPSEE